MKNPIALILLALACGAPDNGDLFEDPPAGDAGAELGARDFEGGVAVSSDGEFGQAAQAIYRSGQFGVDGQGRCLTTSTNCMGAESKTVRLNFLANSCSVWWRARFVEVDQQMTAWGAGSFGWTFTGSTNGNWDLQMSCASSLGGSPVNFAAMLPVSPVTQTTLPDGLVWAQYAQGRLAVDAAEIETFPAWATATEAQRKNFAHNAIKHEIGHFMGLGHNGLSGTTMNNPAQITNPNAFPWSYGGFYTLAEHGWLDCYDPTSDTNPDC